MRYSTKHHYTWNANIAYSVGLITSDGCLQKDQRHIDLTSVDIDQLKNFSLALGRDLSITSKGNKFNASHQPAYRIQFSDVAYYDFLLNAGLTVAKSKTIAKLSIPEEHYRDFLRGIFDGDGSCYAYRDKRWRSSYMYYVTFTSASLDFIQYIQSMNNRIIEIGNGSIRQVTRAYSLAYAKADAYKIFHFMYYSPDVICLQRKFTKLELFTQLDRHVTIK